MNWSGVSTNTLFVNLREDVRCLLDFTFHTSAALSTDSFKWSNEAVPFSRDRANNGDHFIDRRIYGDNDSEFFEKAKACGEVSRHRRDNQISALLVIILWSVFMV